MSSTREAAVLRELAHQARPALVVDLGRIALDASSRSCGLRARPTPRRRLGRAAGLDPPVLRVRAVGLERRGDEARLVAALEHGRARAVAVEEDHRIVFGRPACASGRRPTTSTVFSPGFVAIRPAALRDRGGERRAGAADVERAGVLRAELGLQHDRGGRGDVVGRVGAEDDQVDVLGALAGALERLLRGAQREVGGGPVRRARTSGCGCRSRPPSCRRTPARCRVNRARSASFVTSISGR